MKKLLYIFFILALTLLGVEIVFRLYHIAHYGTMSKPQEQVFLASYPVLEKLHDFEYQKDKINLLVLGGSVVFEDSISLNIKGNQYDFNFCGFSELGEDFNVLNLAFPGHTSLDSRFKMEFLKNYSFDYVLIYHGINDSRSNNVLIEGYKKNYSHMQFYDELWTSFRLQEYRYSLSPYYLELLSKRFLHAVHLRSYIPKEFLTFIGGIDEQIVTDYFILPCIHPSKISFQHNLNEIVELAFQRSAQPILSTYAFYHPSDYTYERFVNDELAYQSNLFPTELYGPPHCVVQGIKAHNKVVIHTARKLNSAVKFIDFEKKLEKKGVNFMDVCHLSCQGCSVFQTELKALIVE